MEVDQNYLKALQFLQFDLVCVFICFLFYPICSPITSGPHTQYLLYMQISPNSSPHIYDQQLVARNKSAVNMRCITQWIIRLMSYHINKACGRVSQIVKIYFTFVSH